MPGIKNSILDTIGNTPIVRINNLGPRNVELFVKVEAFNPLGSVKDRMALATVEAAERSGQLKPGQTIIEATSGNTGIGLAMVCAQKGYPLVVVMSEPFSVERRKLLRFLGAKVVLTPAADKGTGMLNKAEELAETHGWFPIRQFENEANAEVHTRTTAREILRDFEGIGLDYFVTGAGTGGTLNGVSRVLKAESPDTKIIVAEPDNVPILSSGVPQPEAKDGATASHPYFRPHLMQGWTPDFIPKLTEAAMANVDRFIPVGGNDANQCARDLATREGIFCGTSAGATFAAALTLAETAPEGSRILAMLPDTGERYLSTPLFDGIAEIMTDEERDISESSPGYRFSSGGGGAPVVVPFEAPKRHAIEHAEAAIAGDPVVIFALEYCEFCWSVTRLFKAAGIPFVTVDLDSVAYQKDNLGVDLRAALRQMTGAPTIPQVFIAGEHLGGASETFDAFNAGELQAKLSAADIPFDAGMSENAYGFLPKWLHPRSA